MKIHEYQARELLAAYRIPVPDVRLATNPKEAEESAHALGLPVVLKAQVHAGGRGKAGGVRLMADASAVAPAAEEMFRLVIKGLPVRKLLVAKAVSAVREAYLSILIDRSRSSLIFVGCAAGGVEIEETARQSPEKVLRLELPVTRTAPAQFAEYESLAGQLFPGMALAEPVARCMAAMECLFRERDCSLVEINPLVATATGGLLALDAKILFDDNALIRQPANLLLRDPDSEDPVEVEARAAGLSFIGLDGSIGCMVNGAGLAMATMDTITNMGGVPANFLDVGGSSNPEKTALALRLILHNPKVKVVLINIFGGITRCDDVARGLLAALDGLPEHLPLVVRLMGTNEAAGQALLAGRRLHIAHSLEEGAQLAVELAEKT